jgi:hypothetical protein
MHPSLASRISVRARLEMKRYDSMSYRHPPRKRGVQRASRGTSLPPWIPAFAQGCPGKNLAAEKAGNRPPIFVLAGLGRAITPRAHETR